MRIKILVWVVILLCIIAIIALVAGTSENKPKDFIRYINGETSKDPSKYTKIYNNVFIFGIGHNQKEIDKNYKIDGKWIIGKKEYDLAIAPYSGNTPTDALFAGGEHIGIPVVSGKTFAPYKGALFRNVVTHSGGGLAFKNQVEYGTIDYEKATLLAYPQSFSQEVDPRDTYVINKGDPIPYLPWVKYEAIEGKPGVKFGWTIRFGQGESPIKKGPGKRHDLKEYLKNEEPGGVDFTSIRLNYISVRNDSFDYIIKAEKAKDMNQIVTIEDETEISLISFSTGLTLPESEFWVNLNPWEPDRIIEKDLGTTDVGRIMLEADLRMKKDFSRYEDPCESETGVEFWKLLGEKREELVKEIMKRHPDEIKDVNEVQFAPVTRHWIVPDKVEAYETDNEIYIVNATLNIFSEPVYEQSTYNVVNTLTLSKASKEDLSEAAKEYGRYVKELQERKILPLVVREVNSGKNYSDLRQVYISLALAQWYKNKYRHSPSLFSDLIDSKNLNGLEPKSEWSAVSVWKDYKKSFEEGDYHCWKNRTYQQGDYTITESKLYSGGGVDFMDIKITNMGNMPHNLKESLSEAVYSMYAKEGNDYYFGDGLYVYEDIETVTQENSHGHSNQTKNEANNQPEQKTAGFETIFAIAGLLTAACLIKWKK